MKQPNGNNTASLLTDDKTFADVLGQAVWLMSMDPAYKTLPIGMIEGRILPPIILRQFKLYSKGKQPVAFLTWAALDEETAVSFEHDKLTGNNLKFWSLGQQITVVDCVSPFSSRQKFIDAFGKEAINKQSKVV